MLVLWVCFDVLMFYASLVTFSSLYTLVLLFLDKENMLLSTSITTHYYNYRTWGQFHLTWGQLHPRADLVHVPGVAEEEQAEADHGAHDQQHGGPHEEQGGPEGRRRDGGEVQHAAFAHELRGERVPDAVVEEAEVPGLRSIHAVPDPVRLDEDHHGDDDEADGEHGPHHADGSRVSHIVGVVDFSSLLGRKQIHVCELLLNIS